MESFQSKWVSSIKIRGLTMATVSSVEITFKACRNGKSCDIGEESFNAADLSLQTVVDDHFDNLIDELNDGLEKGEDQWEKEEYKIIDWDTDWADPNDPHYFDDLNGYGEYAKGIEMYGEAFHLRYVSLNGISCCDFEDSFAGTFGSSEEWAESVCDNYYGIDELPDLIRSNINWENVAYDLRYDYTEYEGSEGYHYFRD